jgi:hypothetical protein
LFKGAMINGHTGGRFLDDRAYWPIFERAEALGVPVYLHLTYPTAQVMEAYYAGFEAPVSATLAGVAIRGARSARGLASAAVPRQQKPLDAASRALRPRAPGKPSFSWRAMIIT